MFRGFVLYLLDGEIGYSELSVWAAGDTSVPLPGVSSDHPACLILAQDSDQEEGRDMGAAVEHRGVTEEGSARCDRDRTGGHGGSQAQWLALACMCKLFQTGNGHTPPFLPKGELEVPPIPPSPPLPE